jgi:hypothetical protein
MCLPREKGDDMAGEVGEALYESLTLEVEIVADTEVEVDVDDEIHVRVLLE